MKATLQRLETDDQGTFGVLTIDDKTWPSAELPWRDNQRGKSCIPAGTYNLIWQRSPRFSDRAGFDVFKYEFLDIPGRDQVLIHSANFLGDVDKGWDSQAKGCVILGKRIGEMKNSKGVMQKCIQTSGNAVKEFEAYMEGKPLTIEVIDIPSIEQVGS